MSDRPRPRDGTPRCDIFLSYATEDRERVRPLVGHLEEHGWSVWWDRNIPPGSNWAEKIEEALDGSRATVVVWTEMSTKSKWVTIEASEGEKRENLVPVSLDKVDPPLAFRQTQAADLSEWDGSASHPEFRATIASLETILGVPEGVREGPVDPAPAASGSFDLVSHLVWWGGGALGALGLVMLFTPGLVRELLGVLPSGGRTLAMSGRSLTVIMAALAGGTLAVFRMIPVFRTDAGRRLARRARTVVAALAGISVLFVAGDRLVRSGANELAALDVYVVLPFEEISAEGVDELSPISDSYRSTLETVFGGVQSVRIVPSSASSESAASIPPICTLKPLEMWTPDFVLCNQVNLLPADSSLRIVSRLKRVSDGELSPLGRMISKAGKVGEIRYLALLVATDIVQILKTETGLALDAPDEASVMKLVLEEYSSFLKLVGDADPEAEKAVEDLVESGVFEVQTVRRVLDEHYENHTSLDASADLAEANRHATLVRQGGAP